MYEYKVLKSLEGGIGIPKVEWFGAEGQFNIMAMEYLGPNLEELFQFCKKKAHREDSYDDR